MSDTHVITIDQYAESRCGTSGHYDTLIECSCGWSKRLSHGSGKVDLYVDGHRIKVLEQVVGIKTTIQSKARSR